MPDEYYEFKENQYKLSHSHLNTTISIISVLLEKKRRLEWIQISTSSVAATGITTLLTVPKTSIVSLGALSSSVVYDTYAFLVIICAAISALIFLGKRVFDFDRPIRPEDVIQLMMSRSENKMEDTPIKDRIRNEAISLHLHRQDDLSEISTKVNFKDGPARDLETVAAVAEISNVIGEGKTDQEKVTGLDADVVAALMSLAKRGVLPLREINSMPGARENLAESLVQFGFARSNGTSVMVTELGAGLARGSAAGLEIDRP